MSNFSAIGSLNTEQFSRISSQGMQSAVVQSALFPSVGRVGGAAEMNRAAGPSPHGVGQNIDLMA